jgi:hypothetical protein
MIKITMDATNFAAAVRLISWLGGPQDGAEWY